MGDASEQSGQHSLGLVEEVLEQASATALKLGHIDESISELRSELRATRNDVAVLDTKLTRASGIGASAGESFAADRAEHAEAQARGAKRLAAVVLAVSLLQLGATAAILLRRAPAPEPKTTPTVAAVPAPVPVAAAEPVVKPIADPFGAQAADKTNAVDAKAEPKAKKKKRK